MSVILDIKDLKPTNELMEHIKRRVLYQQTPGLSYSRMYHRHERTSVIEPEYPEYEEVQP